MKTHLLCIVTLLLFYTSCEKNNVEYASQLKEDVIILQERDKNLPLILSNKTIQSRSHKINTISKNSPLELKSYLGKSYKIENGLCGDPENIKYPIVKVDEFIQKNPSYLLHKQLRKSETNYFSYSSFNRYQENSNHTKTIKSGWKINLGLFSLGSKKTMTSIFTASITDENTSIFGELNMYLKDASYELLTTTNALDIISWEFLDESFLDELYNTPLYEFMGYFGNTVLTSYNTGGKASAIYTGTCKDATNISANEKSMSKHISSSFKYKVVDGSLEIDFDKPTTGEGSSLENEISNINIAIKTWGGLHGLSIFTPPASIDNVNINLSNWANSLENTSVHNIIEINEGGLLPISAFILEENFKYKINSYTGNNSITKYNKPAIVIWKVRGPYCDYIEMFLSTRHGDRIFFTDTREIPNENDWRAIHSNEEFIEKANYLKDLKKDNYKIDILAIPKQTRNISNETYDEGKFLFHDVDEKKMKKFKHPNYNITYLLYADEKKKCGFAIHDEYILDTYGIRDLYNSLPDTIITQKQLQEYTIIGL